MDESPFSWRIQNQGREKKVLKSIPGNRSELQPPGGRAEGKCSRTEERRKSSKSEMTCRVSGSMTWESFSQCWARANSFSKPNQFEVPSAERKPHLFTPGRSQTAHRQRTEAALVFEMLSDGYCWGCWSVDDIKAPSGVAVMKRLSGFIIASAGAEWKPPRTSWLSGLTQT